MLSSCAPRVPFTQATKEQYRLTESDLKQIQFYASHDIVLQRAETDQSGKETTEGTLILTEGKSVEQVLIRAGTPGIVDKVIDDNRMMVSFEDGADKGLVFGDPFDKKGKYTMLAAEWKNNRGVLDYGGKTWFAAPGASNVYLTFKMKRLRKFRKDSRVVKGRRL